MENKDKSYSHKKKILSILRKSSEGKTITELTEISQLPRSAVRIALAGLDGAKEVNFRRIGMAKVYHPKIYA